MAKTKRDIGVVIDWETSGLLDPKASYRNFWEGPQGIEIGATLVYLPEAETIAEYTSRVRFLGAHSGRIYGPPSYEKLTWAETAQEIHGITLTELSEAPPPMEVARQFVSFVRTNAKIDDPQKVPIMICGHNPEGDAYYTRQLLFFGQVENELRFHYRMIDTFSLGYFVLGAKSSNELFERVSNVVRKNHSAMEDSMLTTEALRTIYKMCRERK